MVAGTALIILASIFFAFMPEQWHGRMGTIQHYEQDQSAMQRIDAWRFAFNLAKERPVIGGGFETFNPSLFLLYAPGAVFQDAHSIYFEILGEHGFVGLGLFLMLGFLALRTGGWFIKNTRDRPELEWHRDLAAMTQVSLMGYAVAGAFLGLAYFDLFYHLLAIMVLNRYLLLKTLLCDAPKALDKIRYSARGRTRLGSRGT